jgi:hypothetical protein
MAPETVKRLAGRRRRRLADRDITFSVRDYREVTPNEGDVLYVDPRYATGEGRYYSGPIEFDELFAWLRKQPCSCFLSLNGFLGDEDRRLDVPCDLFDERLPMPNGENSFDRIAGREPLQVIESLYIRRRGSFW